MSKHRMIDTHFWEDGYVENKDPIEKLLFLYLLTNPLTNIIGIYEISLKRIAFDIGLDREMVEKILERFKTDNKIKYENGWIAIKNFVKHQKKNPNIDKGIETLSKQVPTDLFQWATNNSLSYLNSDVNTNIDMRKVKNGDNAGAYLITKLKLKGGI